MACLTINRRSAAIYVTALAMLTSFALSSTSISAFAAPRHSQGQYFSRDAAAQQYCVPANGAQIMGGFAREGDRLDLFTGETCNR